MTRRFLSAWLVFGGVVLCLAVFPVFFPFAWMRDLHALMGIGELPDLPIVNYLTRSLSLLYTAWGALHLYLAAGVDRHLPVIRCVGWLTLALAPALAVIDLGSGMPWYWTATEGGSVGLYGAALAFAAERRRRELANPLAG